jgi:WD40 repeat protein
VTCLAISPDGKTLATGSWERRGHPIQLWKVESGESLSQLGEKTGAVNALAFSPDGKWLAWAGWSWGQNFNDIHLWELATGKEIHRFTGQRGGINCLSFSPDGKLLASGAHDSTILIWDVSPAHLMNRR